MLRAGYLVLGSLMSDDSLAAFSTALKRSALTGDKDLSREPEFDKLVTDDRFRQLAKCVIGSDPVFHHANGRAWKNNVPSKPWHHDFDGRNTERYCHSMVHVLVYPSGLSSTTGELAVLPGSHLRYTERSAPNCWGSQILRGERSIHGPPGLAVVMFSGLWHCRRTAQLAPGVIRLDFNASYCSTCIDRPERASLAERLERMRARLGDHPMLQAQ